MNKAKSMLFGTVAFIFAMSMITFSAASTAAAVKAISPNALKWGPAPPILPKGAEIAVLSGNPGEAGPFTIRLKLPAGYKIPAHQHPTFEDVTVISGEFNIGMGDKLDTSKADKLTVGSFINLPEKMNHFAFASKNSVVQINSMGPFALTYVNPADDPSKAQ